MVRVTKKIVVHSVVNDDKQISDLKTQSSILIPIQFIGIVNYAFHVIIMYLLFFNEFQTI